MSELFFYMKRHREWRWSELSVEVFSVITCLRSSEVRGVSDKAPDSSEPQTWWECVTGLILTWCFAFPCIYLFSFDLTRDFIKQMNNEVHRRQKKLDLHLNLGSCFNSTFTPVFIKLRTLTCVTNSLPVITIWFKTKFCPSVRTVFNSFKHFFLFFIW